MCIQKVNKIDDDYNADNDYQNQLFTIIIVTHKKTCWIYRKKCSIKNNIIPGWSNFISYTFPLFSFPCSSWSWAPPHDDFFADCLSKRRKHVIIVVDNPILLILKWENYKVYLNTVW